MFEVFVQMASDCPLNLFLWRLAARAVAEHGVWQVSFINQFDCDCDLIKSYDYIVI